ncbi:hypothetical protein ACJMK2_009955 [Sinanodonta woodiana]|uniref:C2H2-type domain-containing protein n=1 Tax=Sinanodonta woodiana TaxID=1069815 RepID=A0ABD3VDV2_SINWO
MESVTITPAKVVSVAEANEGGGDGKAHYVTVKGPDDTMQVIMLTFNDADNGDGSDEQLCTVTNIEQQTEEHFQKNNLSAVINMEKGVQTESMFSLKDPSIVSSIVGNRIKASNLDATQSVINGIFTCGLCAKVYRNKSSWQSHLQTHAGKDILMCGICGRFFSDKSVLAYHLENHSVHTRKNSKSLKNRDTEITLRVGRVVMPGDDVMKRETPDPTSFVNPSSISEEAEIASAEDLTDGTSYVYACNICGQQYNTKVECELHLRVHGEISFAEGENEKHLQSQTEEDSGKEKKSSTHDLLKTSSKSSAFSSSASFIYACNVCGKQYTNKSNCKRHMRIHTGEEKTFECTHCHKKFAMKYELRMHSRIHTGEKPFECAVCGKTFVERGNWKRHTKIHLREQEDAPYRCALCSKGFFYAEKLQVHLQIHSGRRPYVCTVCGREAKKIGDMYRHLRTHTGEKPYECQVCGKGFTQNGNLKDHMKTHTGPKVLHCNKCGEQFFRKVHLQEHMKKMHRQKNVSIDIKDANGEKENGNNDDEEIWTAIDGLEEVEEDDKITLKWVNQVAAMVNKMAGNKLGKQISLKVSKSGGESVKVVNLRRISVKRNTEKTSAKEEVKAKDDATVHKNTITDDVKEGHETSDKVKMNIDETEAAEKGYPKEDISTSDMATKLEDALTKEVENMEVDNVTNL